MPFLPDFVQRPEAVQEPGFHFNGALSSLLKEPKDTPCIYPGLHDRVGLSQAVSPGALVLMPRVTQDAVFTQMWLRSRWLSHTVPQDTKVPGDRAKCQLLYVVCFMGSHAVCSGPRATSHQTL